MDSSAFLNDIRVFDTFGPIQSVVEHDVPYFVGQFWTAKQRQGHSIHEISYRGCFKAELPAFFIDRLSSPGETVYDPFAGRGTTLVQAALMERRPVGNDINPLSAMLSRPRMAVPTIDEVKLRLVEIPWRSSVWPQDIEAPNTDLLVFFHPHTLQDILALRDYLLQREATGTLDPVDDWIRMVALNRLTGHSSGYFSVYTLPPNQAASVAAQRKINADRNQTPPRRDVARIVLNKTRALLRNGTMPPCQPVLLTGPAWRTPDLPDHSVSLVVTSPPFLDVIQYDKDNWLRCWFAGIDVRNVGISQTKNAAEWQHMVRDVLLELARVTHPGGHVAFEVGEVRGGKVLLERFVWAAAAGLPFDRLGVIVNGGTFTKTANIWQVANNTNGTNTNRIVMLRRQ